NASRQAFACRHRAFQVLNALAAQRLKEQGAAPGEDGSFLQAGEEERLRFPLPGSRFLPHLKMARYCP
ncbi:hypothetical protein, partial [uncultured Desulfovibrio sp.]|uniref:hypothetical protein n=1 Tax=uncultured Desulfovibrio sp. TaxID=167968 RepID=UPI0026DBE13C